MANKKTAKSTVKKVAKAKTVKTVPVEGKVEAGSPTGNQ